jgi:hypothetical protein
MPRRLAITGGYKAEVREYTDEALGSTQVMVRTELASGKHATTTAMFDDSVFRGQVFDPGIPDDGSYAGLAGDQRQQRYWFIASKGRSIENWLRSIDGDGESMASGMVGRAGVELAEAVYRSSASGEAVLLPLTDA